ncbi:hypothetical protein [Mucilaginibacter flavidus]|uniref:hypothetical protein n=1 Tax=Mucilaginibacter flavidus TaxID=2949309 RepID=UPI0020923BE6|nr:hypothetical protein [Mucilaginibacter flavidus]MCO5947701.1 hypothetical protein [Mucilaginibacter flavidus]
MAKCVKGLRVYAAKAPLLLYLRRLSLLQQLIFFAGESSSDDQPMVLRSGNVCFFLRAACECEATRPGKARSFYQRRAAGCQSRMRGVVSRPGAVAEPAGGPNKRQRLQAVTCFYRQVADRTEVAAMSKSEERKKHDRLSPLLPAAWVGSAFYPLKKLSRFIKCTDRPGVYFAAE